MRGRLTYSRNYLKVQKTFQPYHCKKRICDHVLYLVFGSTCDHLRPRSWSSKGQEKDPVSPLSLLSYDHSSDRSYTIDPILILYYRPEIIYYRSKNNWSYIINQRQKIIGHSSLKFTVLTLFYLKDFHNHSRTFFRQKEEQGRKLNVLLKICPRRPSWLATHLWRSSRN